MSAPGTKQKLLSLIEDVEIVSKELLDFLSTPKQNRPEEINDSQLVDLLVEKDKEIQETLKSAEEQVELQKKFDALKAEVDKRNQDVKLLQKNLKEAESILATAIFQAKQKLKSINQAKSKKISSEELIKYAHKISASNAVAAPPTWGPGDPRRPYPTDMDMRMGLLGTYRDLPNNHPAVTGPGNFPGPDAINSRSQSLDLGIQSTGQPSSGPTGISWQPSMDLPTTGGSSLPSHTMDSKGHKESEDVELMSSDSSSSSSSDE